MSMVTNTTAESKPTKASSYDERESMPENNSQESLKERLTRKKASLSDNARTVLEKRYLKKDENGKVIETPEEMFFRVAENIASAERLFGTKSNPDIWTEKFYNMMVDLDFFPTRLHS
jgi:ribonucleotide reductase alpha subunit